MNNLFNSNFLGFTQVGQWLKMIEGIVSILCMLMYRGMLKSTSIRWTCVVILTPCLTNMLYTSDSI